jgi:hypothetical protein
MKKALSRIVGFFVGPERRDKSNPVQHRYCICGALMPEVKRHEPKGVIQNGAASVRL